MEVCHCTWTLIGCMENRLPFKNTPIKRQSSIPKSTLNTLQGLTDGTLDV